MPKWDLGAGRMATMAQEVGLPRRSRWGWAARWGFPLLLLHAWMASRLVSYFWLGAAWGLKEFELGVLPPDAHPSVADTFWRLGVQPLHDKLDRYYSIRIHIVAAVVMSIACSLNLLPSALLPWHVHRMLGRAFFCCLPVFTVELWYILFVKGMLPIGNAAFYADAFVGATIPTTALLGLYYARARRFRQHRACMILTAAALFYIPTQRLLWVLLSKTQLLGPLDSWSAMITGPTDVSILLALITNYGMGTWYAFAWPAGHAASSAGTGTGAKVTARASFPAAAAAQLRVALGRRS